MRKTVQRILGILVFGLLGMSLLDAAPSADIAWVCAVLLLTIYLFVFEIVEVDTAAVSIMVLLGLLGALSPLLGLDRPLVPAEHMFDGFASNAVISIIAVMIIGAGLDRTGVMNRVAGLILRHGGATEQRIIPLISGAVGIISSFMQNVGAAALFLPVVSRISARTGLPLSRLLMPMGFCAILGGTITMVGSSPLILLNDLIINSNRALPPDRQMETFHLFSVTPIGLALLITGILYFVYAGRYVLPLIRTKGPKGGNTADYLKRVYDISFRLNEVVVPEGCVLAGQTIDDVEKAFRVRIVGLYFDRKLKLAPGDLDRDLVIPEGARLAVLASNEQLQAFIDSNGLRENDPMTVFTDALAVNRAGIAEVVVPPDSELIGKTARELCMRKTYGLSLLVLYHRGQTIREHVRDITFEVGDCMVCHVTWENLFRLENNRNFLVVTADYPREQTLPHKVNHALFFFLLALVLVLFTDMRLSLSLLTGALGMILSGVLSMDDAYKAVSWKTVFLLASLIPLGLAVENTGTAAWIAQQTLAALGDVPPWVIQAALALLATFFTLVMSNVGATVLLVPLAVNLALQTGADPAVFALTIALATSNSFLIPTHQVNALLMGPAGYKMPDFIRAGSVMTLLFLLVMLIMMNIMY